jgi:hypothetical protein
MKKDRYIKREIIQVLVYPVFQLLVTWFCVAVGWIKVEHVQVVWSIIIVTVLASLLSVAAVWLFEK